jgi:hypothetical protein
MNVSENLDKLRAEFIYLKIPQDFLPRQNDVLPPLFDASCPSDLTFKLSMICQNCRATVDNDLVFCTECGARLYETMSNVPTIALNDSVVTKVSAPPVEKSSPFKWIALIIGLIALPATLGIAYLLLKNQPVVTVSNVNKSASTNRKSAANTPNKNINTAAPNVNANAAPNTNIGNANSDNTDQNANAADSTASVVIFDDQLEIAAGEHVAYPFKLDGDAKIIGKLQTVSGESLQGYVFTQDAYDEHFPDAIYKMFSFDGSNPIIEQHLIKGEYVLIFLNETASATVVKGKVEVLQSNE